AMKPTPNKPYQRKFSATEDLLDWWSSIMSYTAAAAAEVAAVLASHQVLIFKVGKLWLLKRRREITEYREVVTSLVGDFLIRCHGLINKHQSRVLIENQSCRKASDKAIIEWESAKTVVEELIIMANLPPPNHVADLPEDDPEEQPELAPEPDHLNGFALHQNPQPEGNMNGWILEDDEEEEEEEDPEMEEEMEEENDDDDDAEVINPYEEADPLNLPPPDSDTESEDMAVAPTPDDHEQEAEADTVGTITRVPYSVRPFSGTFYVGSGCSRQVFAPVLTRRDVNTLHHKVKGLA
ncbi:hypothetical protein Tco_1155662, partial [Tanacetum coccineum]